MKKLHYYQIIGTSTLLRLTVIANELFSNIVYLHLIMYIYDMYQNISVLWEDCLIMGGKSIYGLATTLAFGFVPFMLVQNDVLFTFDSNFRLSNYKDNFTNLSHFMNTT